ncbi:MAG: class IV adenylate cyclase [Planctomycetota bacterium]|jgi:predicted adenylyl cyclase CyaB
MTGRNVEIKARVANPHHTESIAAQIADSGPVNIEQEDIFFNCPRGRLKLRKFSHKEGELIYYNRDDAPEPAECNYSILKTSYPTLLGRILAKALGVRGIVRKSRTLYLFGRTRIHFDDVSGLGKFVEIEVVLSPGQAVSEGRDIAESVMQRLGISEHELIDAAYIDMVLK